MDQQSGRWLFVAHRLYAHCLNVERCEPVTDWASHADVYTGLEGAIAVLAGLNKRNATGTGLHGDVSMMATMAAVNERLHAQINELDAADEPLALGAPESPIFKVADGSFVTIAASPISSGVFMRYCGMMGRNDLRTRYWPGGRLRARSNYKDGLKEGIAKSWHFNGKIATRRNFTRGKLIGEVKRWSEAGEY